MSLITRPELTPLVDFFEDAGGIFAILMFVHFLADFIHQGFSKKESKSYTDLATLKHSFIYTIHFLPLMIFLQMQMWEVVAGFIWLLLTHFIVDTHYFTKKWVFNLYHPEDPFSYRIKDSSRGVLHAAYNKWRQTPDGRVMFFVLDQIQHATTLWPIVLMILY